MEPIKEETFPPNLFSYKNMGIQSDNPQTNGPNGTTTNTIKQKEQKPKIKNYTNFLSKMREEDDSRVKLKEKS